MHGSHVPMDTRSCGCDAGLREEDARNESMVLVPLLGRVNKGREGGGFRCPLR
ncbi:unnamed protein product [Ectocarpus sp. 6 AP-2014]